MTGFDKTKNTDHSRRFGTSVNQSFNICSNGFFSLWYEEMLLSPKTILLLIRKGKCEYDHVLLGPRSSSVLPSQGYCLWRRGNIKSNICRARVEATKTLGLAVMEIKLTDIFFWNETQFRRSNGPKRVQRVYSWHVTRPKICVTGEKQLKDIRDSWIYEKVWLKAAKSISGTWILLKFERETLTQPPYLPSKLLCHSCRFQFTSFWILNLRYSTKLETDVLEITTFLPASDSPLFVSRLLFQRSYLGGVITASFSTILEQRKPRIRIPRYMLCNQLIIGRRCTILPSCIAFLHHSPPPPPPPPPTKH